MMSVLTAILVLLMIAAALTAAVVRSLMGAVIAVAVVSVLASVIFLVLHAPDVAMAEAAIGAGLTTAIFVLAVRKTKGSES